MLNLIRHEMKENQVLHITAGCVIIGQMALLLMDIGFRTDGFTPSLNRILSEWTLTLLPVMVFIIMPLIGLILGYTHMAQDRLRKISTYLATLSVTRAQIFTSRIITGMGFLLIMCGLIHLLELFLIHINLAFNINLEVLDFSIRFLFVSYLFTLTGFALGLLGGLHPSLLRGIPGMLIVTICLFGVILIHGPTPAAFIILTLILLVALIRSWQKYRTMPL